MEEVLNSKMLEYDKSTFLIDLVKHRSGLDYVKIQQSIEGSNSFQELKINFSVLSDLIVILESFKKEISQSQNQINKGYFNEDKQKLVVERYLKGIPLPDLSLQFDCNVEIIKQILFNKEIEIVDNKMPRWKSNYRFRKKK